jgi:MoaA/NifB/PqqE/SkfB family radical SAM enzyme
MKMYDTPRKIDIIYNSTLVCPWDCAVCCVDAVHVKKRGGLIEINSDGLRTLEHIQGIKGESIYDAAAKHRQSKGLELDIAAKRKVIDHLVGYEARIDVSGGDALSVRENFGLLEYAASRLGKVNVTLTVTGAGSSAFRASDIAPYIGEYNFTFDAETLEDVALRPDGYAAGNLKKARAFVQVGIPTRAETPLSRPILNEDHLSRLYMALHNARIDKLLVMRLFPVGRGALLEDEIPSAEDYRFAITVLKRLEAKYGWPIVKVQCALKHLVGLPSSSGGNPCDLVTESFGLMADGTLLASPWAIGATGRPLGPEWVLGNLARDPMTVILSRPKALAFHGRAGENWGHCKIFSYLNSSRSDPFERIFDTADPVVAGKAAHLPAHDQLSPTSLDLIRE